MQRFILKENIARFQRQLTTEINERTRDRLRMMLLATERELAMLDAGVLGAHSCLLPAFNDDQGTTFASLFRREFENSAFCYLVIDPGPGLHIVDINNVYGAATMTDRSRLAGMRLFEIFPDNPDDPTADGISNLYASLKTAVDARKPHAMAIQRYDIRDPQGRFVERYWRSINTPIVDGKGRLRYLLHHTEDVTGEILSERSHATGDTR